MKPLRPDEEAQAVGSYRGPHARTCEPVTSKAAAERAEASGLVEGDAAIFARFTREQPGITIPEMAERLMRETVGDIDACPPAVRKFMLESFRQRLGRRAGDVQKRGQAYPLGTRGDFQCWWPKGQQEMPSPYTPTAGGAGKEAAAPPAPRGEEEKAPSQGALFEEPETRLWD